MRGLFSPGKGAEGRAGRGAPPGARQRPLLPQPWGPGELGRGGQAGAPSAAAAAALPAVPRKELPGRGRGQCVQAALGLLAPASFVWCHRAENGESGERGPHSFGRLVSGDGELGRRSWARCLSLSELAAERGPSVRAEGVVGPGLLLCACFPVGPGGWCVLEDGAMRARG